MNKLYIKRIGALAALSCLLTGMSACAGGRSGSDVNSRLAQLESRVNTISTQIDGTQSAEVWNRMQSMEGDLNVVRNQMNDLSQRMSGPKGNQVLSANERLDRMEAALLEISNTLGIKVEALEEPYIPAPQPPAEQLYGSGAAVSPAAGAVAPAGTTQVINSDGTVTVLINGEPRQVPIAPGAVPGQANPQIETPQPGDAAAPVSSGAAPSDDIAQNLYNQGLDLFNNYKYSDALICFQDFTDNYQNHALTGNAWFWQGECSYQLKDYPAAVVAYQRVITDYPDHNKYVSSLLKQGMALSANGNREQARVRWKEITSRFPKTPEATRAKQLLAGKG
ncbi:MAG: tol-pal system protein YbgF [Desulfovibrionaceae bacterium]|nr:tol-pal system protein YbgF [Desulfovibrionaceae bacterium]